MNNNLFFLGHYSHSIVVYFHFSLKLKWMCSLLGIQLQTSFYLQANMRIVTLNHYQQNIYQNDT